MHEDMVNIRSVCKVCVDENLQKWDGIVWACRLQSDGIVRFTDKGKHQIKDVFVDDALVVTTFHMLLHFKPNSSPDSYGRPHLFYRAAPRHAHASSTTRPN